MSTADLEQQLLHIGSKYGYNNLKARLSQQKGTVTLTWSGDDGILRFKVEMYEVPKTNSYYCETYLARYLKQVIDHLEMFGNI